MKRCREDRYIVSKQLQECPLIPQCRCVTVMCGYPAVFRSPCPFKPPAKKPWWRELLWWLK